METPSPAVRLRCFNVAITCASWLAGSLPPPTTAWSFSLEEATGRHRVTWQWLKGHAGYEDNERCNQLPAADLERVRRNYTPEKLAALRDAFIASRDPGRNQGSLF
jgi:hypothetical protein